MRKVERLSPEQLDVCLLLADGLSTAEAAHLLNVTYKSAERARSKAHRRLNVKTRSELTQVIREEVGW